MFICPNNNSHKKPVGTFRLRLSRSNFNPIPEFQLWLFILVLCDASAQPRNTEKDKTCKWRAAAECQSGAQNWLNCCLTQHWAVSSIRLGAKRIPTNSQSCLTISSTTSCAAALVTINDHEPHWVFLSMLFCCFLCSMSALDGVLHNYWMSNLYWSKVLELPLESRSHHVQLVFHFNPFSRSATWVKFSENQSPKIKAHTLMDTQPTIAALPFYCLYLGLAYSLYWPVFVSWAMFCNHIFN